MPVWARYLTTTVLVLSAFGVCWAIADRVNGPPLMVFFPGITLSAFLFDRGNGIYATLLSALLSVYYFVPHHLDLSAASSGDAFNLLVFVITGIMTAALIEALHSAYVDLAAAHMKLDSAAQQRELLLHELSHRTRNDLATIAALLNLQWAT